MSVLNIVVSSNALVRGLISHRAGLNDSGFANQASANRLGIGSVGRQAEDAERRAASGDLVTRAFSNNGSQPEHT